MTNPKLFTKSNRCPVCDDYHGCRESVDKPGLILCLGRAFKNSTALIKGAEINGYKYLRPDSSNTWELFIPVEMYYEGSFRSLNKTSYLPTTDKELIRKESDKKAKAEKAKEKQNRIKKQLPLDILHEQAQRLIDELSLSDRHLKHLLGRGYTLEQIKERQFRTFPANYVPSVELDDRFPGYSVLEDFEPESKMHRFTHLKGKKFFLSFDDSILIPRYNVEGKIISFTRHNIEALKYNEKSPKYQPISNSRRECHRDGELPVELHLAEGDHKIVLLVEGGGYKAHLAHLKLNVPVIDVQGGMFYGSPDGVNQAIAKCKEIYGDDIELIDVPDGGDIINHGVMLRRAKYYPLYNIKKVLWWGQTDKKATPDIDELESLENAEYISIQDFLEMEDTAYSNTDNSAFNLCKRLHRELKNQQNIEQRQNDLTQSRKYLTAEKRIKNGNSVSFRLLNETEETKLSQAEQSEEKIKPKFIFSYSEITSKSNKTILLGNIENPENISTSDKNECIVKVIRDYRGFKQWLSKYNTSLKESENYIYEILAANLGLNSADIPSILATYDMSNCKPSYTYVNDGERLLWQNLLFSSEATRYFYNLHCPEKYKYYYPTKEAIEVEALIQSDGSEIDIRIFKGRARFTDRQLATKYTPDEIISSRYLNLELSIDAIKGFMYFIKSNMGTGKTFFHSKLIVKALTKGLGCIVMTPRQLLNGNIKERVLKTIAKHDKNLAKKYEKKIHIINQDVTAEEIAYYEADDIIVLCAESLRRITAHFNNKMVAIDELNTLLEQACSKSNTSDKLHLFGALAQMGNDAHSIMVYDANLNDISCRFTEKCLNIQAENKKSTRKVLNDYKNPLKFIRLLAVKDVEKLDELSTRDQTLVLEKAIKATGNVYFQSDAKEFLEAVERLLRKPPTDENGNNLWETKNTFLLSSETKNQTWKEYLNDPTLPEKTKEKFIKEIVDKQENPEIFLNQLWSREFLLDPDAFLKKYRKYYDVFLQSPSGSTGISVDNADGIIKVQICYLMGVISVEEASQMIARVRNSEHEITRYLYYGEISYITTKNKASKDDFDKVYDLQLDVSFAEGLTGESARKQAEDAANEIINNYIWRDYTKHLEYYKDYEKTNYGACLTWLAVSQGNVITEEVDTVKIELKKILKATKEGIRGENSVRITKAKILTETEKNAYKDRNDKDARARKIATYKEERYPGITNHPTWKNPDVIGAYHENAQKSRRIDNAVMNRITFEFYERMSKVNEWYSYNNVTSKDPKERQQAILTQKRIELLVKFKFGLDEESQKEFIKNVSTSRISNIKLILDTPSGREWKDEKKVREFIKKQIEFLGLNLYWGEELTDSSFESQCKNHVKFLLDSKLNQLIEFEKEGKFLNEDAWKYWNNNKAKMTGYEELPNSLKRKDDEINEPEVKEAKTIQEIERDEEQIEFENEITTYMVDAYKDKNTNLLVCYLQCLSVQGYSYFRELQKLASSKINDAIESCDFIRYTHELWYSVEVQSYREKELAF
ncbi:hypothetical protein H6G27_34235 [Nostoc linckia FACHB-104]|nr:hypothetical protein [Nostoc linckia FACHB-104]